MQKYGLTGFPLGHSFSEQYFTAKFERENLFDCSYNLFPFENIDDLKEFVQKDPEIKGINVTIPHKKHVIPLLDWMDPVVSQTGACNCIKIENGKWRGYNTDVEGFQQSLLPLIQPHHTAAMILGTGGSSQAVQYVLRKMQIPFICISRHSLPNEQVKYYDQITENMISSYPIIINTTPVGMFPHIEQFPPIPYQYLSPVNLLYDLIYNPLETCFLKKGNHYGCTTKNGLEMLQIQAEVSWKIWTI